MSITYIIQHLIFFVNVVVFFNQTSDVFMIYSPWLPINSLYYRQSVLIVSNIIGIITRSYRLVDDVSPLFKNLYSFHRNSLPLQIHEELLVFSIHRYMIITWQVSYISLCLAILFLHLLLLRFCRFLIRFTKNSPASPLKCLIKYMCSLHILVTRANYINFRLVLVSLFGF